MLGAKDRAAGRATEEREEWAGAIYTASEPMSSAACCGRPHGCRRGRVSMPASSASTALADIELACVRQLVALQESIGLDVVTDGEIGRLNFQDSFGLAVSGFDAAPETLQVHQRRAAGGGPLRRWDIPDLAQTGTAVSHRRPTVARLALTNNVALAEYKRTQAVAKKPVKVSLIGPDRILQRFDHQASKAVYPDMDAFCADVVALERRMVAELVEAGCRYVHIDAPGFTAYADPPSLAAMRARGEDPEANFARSIAAEAAVVSGFDNVTFGIHLCRGNQRSMWHREGTYDAVAERLVQRIAARPFSARVRFATRGRLRAATLRAERQDRRAWPGQHQSA